MDDILKFTETDALNQANLDFYETLMKEKEGVNLHIANSLWLNDWYSFRDEFRNSMENYYDAEITEVDMASPTTPKIINAWVDEKTNGRIKNIIEPPIDPQTIAFLMNAIYLKADWKYAFDPSLNQQEQFQLSNGATKDVEMMTRMEELEYLEN